MLSKILAQGGRPSHVKHCRLISDSARLLQQYVPRAAATMNNTSAAPLPSSQAGGYRTFGPSSGPADQNGMVDESMGGEEGLGGSPSPHIGAAPNHWAPSAVGNRFNSQRSSPSYGSPSYAPAVGGNLSAGSSIDSTKPGINPFPEELTQDYSNPMLFSGASEASFGKEVSDILQAPLNPADVEIKPDGALYLPENRYRKVLNRAFGPGGWSLVPRGAHSLLNGVLSREYALLCNGRFVSQARGHATIQGFSNPAMASEVVRSNALMRVCKDMGVGNELWDPAFVANWKDSFAVRRAEHGKVRWFKKQD